MATDHTVRQTPSVENLLFAKPKVEHIGHQTRILIWSTTAKVTITFLTFLAVFLEHLFTFKLLRYTPLYLCAHWLTSIVYIFIFHLLAKRKSSLR
jgi:hypothetical protein